MTGRRGNEPLKDPKLSSKLRMDAKFQTAKHSVAPIGSRKEIENVMKRARARPASPNSNAYWDRKLIEVEAKDPNRWCHTGYKSLYLDETASPAQRRSRSKSSNRFSGPKRSPVNRRTTHSPPNRRFLKSPSTPRCRSPINRKFTNCKAPYTSPTHKSLPSNSRRLPSARRSPVYSNLTNKKRSPNGQPNSSSRLENRSVSASSISSCSDDSCSVCSPKNRKRRKSRSRSHSVVYTSVKDVSRIPVDLRARSQRHLLSPPSCNMNTPLVPCNTRVLAESDKPTDPRRPPPPPKPRGRTGEIIELPGVKLLPKAPSNFQRTVKPALLSTIKTEKTKKRTQSPGGSSTSEVSSNSSFTHTVATTSLTLSERFGKIAQWSADRERREMENMKITKTDGNLKVMIEEDDFLHSSSPKGFSMSPVQSVHHPDELISGSPSGNLAAWDDVRVRYQYYKDLGYLRDLSLEDYVKWEDWWYKYQDWLANERHYEHWLRTQNRRRSRKRLSTSQRIN